MGFRGVGPRWDSGEAGRPGTEAQVSSRASLSPSYFFSRIENKERKRKRGLGKDFGLGDNFPELTKICLFRENRKGED